MRVDILYNNPTPLYKQIADQIREKVLAGELVPGQPLPSIRQLAEDARTSVITTRRAYSDLEAEGIIVTRPGLGSFVAELDQSRLRDASVRLIRERLRELAGEARARGISADEFVRLAREAVT